MSERHSYILAGVRTPFGKRNGKLSKFSALDLGVLAVNELGRRYPIAADADAALFGMVLQAGLGVNPARTVMYRSNVGNEIAATTLNSACLSGIDGVVDATRRIERGEGELYIVGGFDSTSGAPTVQFPGQEPVSAMITETLNCTIGGASFAELSDEKNRSLGISRERQDEWALLSQLRAAQADFEATGELFGIETDGALFHRDEGIRPSTTIKTLSGLPTVTGVSGSITAGNASQISDGASVGIIGSLSMAKNGGLTPLARVVSWGYSSGPDSTLHLQPVKSTRRLLEREGLRASDIDLWEVNEAFAGVVVATISDLGIQPHIVNVNGGAISLGHPNGATGFRLVLTLAHELKRRNLRRGIATMCGGGGQGIALLIENQEFVT